MAEKTSSMLRLPPEHVKDRLLATLQQRGFAAGDAHTLAQTFLDNSLDGVPTHGLNRFPRFIGMVDRGHVKTTTKPVLKNVSGNIQQWDGRLAAGILNALQATDHAMELARESGIGCVGLGNTNHWMRGGTYGWRAARKGFIFIGWTNTIANMPAWGAQDSKLGNNPLVLAVPYGNDAIVLDMAQSQFSYGAMEAAHQRGDTLPVAGGYDTDGKLTKTPGAILESQRALPAGYWKGAGLSLLLDILATLISGGRSTADITRQGSEYGVSQVFIAIDTHKLGNAAALQQLIEGIITDYQQSQPANPNGSIRYPSQGAAGKREQNQRDGVPVAPEVWDEIQALSPSSS